MGSTRFASFRLNPKTIRFLVISLFPDVPGHGSPPYIVALFSCISQPNDSRVRNWRSKNDPVMRVVQEMRVQVDDYIPDLDFDFDDREVDLCVRMRRTQIEVARNGS